METKMSHTNSIAFPNSRKCRCDFGRLELTGEAAARLQLFVMLAEIGVERLGAGCGKQRLEHHVAAVTFREMLAIGLSQGFDARVAVLLVDAAGRIAMPTVQCLLGHVKLPGFFDKPSLPRSPRGV